VRLPPSSCASRSPRLTPRHGKRTHLLPQRYLTQIPLSTNIAISIAWCVLASYCTSKRPGWRGAGKGYLSPYRHGGRAKGAGRGWRSFYIQRPRTWDPYFRYHPLYGTQEWLNSAIYANDGTHATDLGAALQLTALLLATYSPRLWLT
jgi:hypothetical protein